MEKSYDPFKIYAASGSLFVETKEVSYAATINKRQIVENEGVSHQIYGGNNQNSMEKGLTLDLRPRAILWLRPSLSNHVWNVILKRVCGNQ